MEELKYFPAKNIITVEKTSNEEGQKPLAEFQLT